MEGSPVTMTTEPSASTTAGWAAELFGVIYEPGDIVEIRPLIPGEEEMRAGRRWPQADGISSAAITAWMQAANDDGHCIYFGANPRSRSGGKAEDVLLARCLFADFDGGVEVEDALARIELAGKPWPSAVVHSGNGVHLWWRLTEPITDMEAWTRCQKKLAGDIGSDPVVSDAPRLMRVPGYVNTKYEHKPTCRLDETSGEVFDVRDILPGGIPPKPLEFRTDSEPVEPGSMSRQTRRFLDEGYVFAKGGRRCTAFTAACDLKARGWKLADAQCEIMKAVPKLGLAPKEAADIPRQIASAFSRDRTPIADRTVFTAGAVVATATAPSAAGGAANVADRTTWNDTGLGLRVIEESAGRIRWVVDRGIWVRWNGKHWEDDHHASEAQRIAKVVGGKLWDELHQAGPSAPMPLVRFVMNVKNRRSIDAAIAMAKSETGAEVRSAEFDTNPDVLNVANGILDLRTRELRPHDPAAMLTKLAGVNYEPGATCPKWLAFIDAVTCGDKALAGFLQRSFGLALSADQSEQRLWIHHGEGSNGKGTALAVLHRVFGTYAGPAPVEILLARRQDGDREIGVAKLAGKRLAFAQEADDGVRLSEATVKALTGSDPLTGRFLYQNNFEVMPTWHLHLAVNDRPSIRGTDHGIWRRVTLVPWSHTFTDAEKRPRATVEAELLAEGPGILNWLLDGYESWRADGLRPPAAVDAATSEYRSESDSVRAWIADACTVEAAAETPATDLFVNYRDWCRRAGDRGVSQTKFGRTLDALGHGKELPRSGQYRDRTVRMGLRIVHRHEDVDAEPAYSSPMDARF